MELKLMLAPGDRRNDSDAVPLSRKRLVAEDDWLAPTGQTFLETDTSGAFRKTAARPGICNGVKVRKVGTESRLTAWGPPIRMSASQLGIPEPKPDRLLRAGTWNLGAGGSGQTCPLKS
jgi:hypothetical protein